MNKLDFPNFVLNYFREYRNYLEVVKNQEPLRCLRKKICMTRILIAKGSCHIKSQMAPQLLTVRPPLRLVHGQPLICLRLRK
jgi:hypothetical protein